MKNNPKEILCRYKSKKRFLFKFFSQANNGYQNYKLAQTKKNKLNIVVVVKAGVNETIENSD